MRILKLKNIDQIIKEYGADRSYLIQILLRIQKENGWLPKKALSRLSQKLGVPVSQIYHIATFYKAFSLVPRGRHSISVCMGTACHVRGAPRLLDKVTETMHLQPGETSRDLRYTLETVNCLGCCALGPVMVADGEYYGNPSSKEIKEVLASKK